MDFKSAVMETEKNELWVKIPISKVLWSNQI